MNGEQQPIVQSSGERGQRGKDPAQRAIGGRYPQIHMLRSGVHTHGPQRFCERAAIIGMDAGVKIGCCADPFTPKGGICKQKRTAGVDHRNGQGNRLENRLQDTDILSISWVQKAREGV
nr:hypothetical protein [Rhizobium terrae]